MSLIRHLRDHWHLQRRDRKLAAALRQADILVCFHAKSGSTWLRAMISHVYHRLYGTPADLLIHYGNLQRHAPTVPFVYFGDGLEVRRHGSGQLLARARPKQRVIFLLRDPRDVSVSFYHHLRERATPRELLRKQVPERVRQLSLYDFLLDPEFGLQRVIHRYNLWAAEAGQFEQASFITYEALWEAPVEELGRTMAVLGEEPPPEILQVAVDFASFPSLKEKERSGFFQGERLKPTQIGETQAFKVREGGTQGYRRHFTSAQLATIDEMVARQLDPRLGYGEARTAAGARA
ncbi:sulfotransferase domain-containing protein [Fodinicurvata fenggangensis]|uniref:sulfotransferase domain-containing protein n=1 Tax=Fodinicurvata fenggangensis TaxID=1121830 RepID=UPI00047DE347|nr:sulfotransferase domain-containing protein [Fodinicurvata fenggangensis]